MDASIIEEPSSIKDRAGKRDPEMHQTRKGNQWHFGMKPHIGVESETGIVHSMTATAANVHTAQSKRWTYSQQRCRSGSGHGVMVGRPREADSLRRFAIPARATGTACPPFGRRRPLAGRPTARESPPLWYRARKKG